MGDVAMLVIRVVHIFAGAFWFGAALMVAGFVGPSVKAMGPDGGRFMQQLMRRRRLAVYMAAAGGLTVLTGLAYLGHGLSSEMWRASTYGRVMMFGGLSGMLAFVVGHAVNAPAAKKLTALGATIQSAGGPPTNDETAEVRRLQQRLQTGGVMAAVLLSLSVVAMAAASQL